MEDSVSLQELLQFSKRHRLRVLKAAGATVGVVMAFTFLVTPIYETESLLLVRLGREYMYRPEVGEREAMGLSLSKDRQTAQVNTELQILRSQDVLEEVVGTVGVNRLYPGLSDKPRPSEPATLRAAARRFESDMGAEHIKDSDVIRVIFRHSDPELTAEALNVFVDKFMAKHLSAFSDASATAFLEKKVTSYRDELQKAAEKLKAFQMQSGSFSVDDQSAAFFAQRRDLETAVKRTRNEVAGLQQKLAYLRSEKEKAATDTNRITSEENKAVADARAQLLDLQLQEQKLLATYNDKSRAVENVRNQIKLVEEYLAEQRGAIGQGQFVEDLEKQIVATVAELRFQEARADNLAGQIRRLEQQISDLTESGTEYSSLVREREAAEKNYQTYSKKLEEFRVSEEMDRQKIANISVIQAAGVPGTPIRPRKKLNLLVGALLGLAIGYGWAFAVEFRQRSSGIPAVIPVDQDTLVAPGTVHWRPTLRDAEAGSEDEEAPSAPKGSGV